MAYFVITGNTGSQFIPAPCGWNGGADYSTLTRVQSQKRNRIHRTGVNKAKLDCSTTGILQEYGEYG